MIFFKTNDLKSFERTWKKDSFSPNERNFQKISKNDRSFTERAIFRGKNYLKTIIFYWTNDFIERSFSEKMNEINEEWVRTKSICLNDGRNN